MSKRGSQKGSLRRRGDSWHGGYSVYGPRGKGAKTTIVLGKCAEVSEKEARAKLLDICAKNNRHLNILLQMNPRILATRVSFPVGDAVPAHARGAIAELLVACDLTSRGYEVYRPISGAASCDILYVHDGLPVKVEVKMCNGEWVHVGRNLGKFDILAVVDGHEIHYLAHSQLPKAELSLNWVRKQCLPEKGVA